MMQLARSARIGLVSAALLVSACGGGADEAATNNSAAAAAIGANDFAIGPDASAMETVASGNAADSVLPMDNMTAPGGGNGMTGNGAAPTAGSASGGGNSVESNVSGM